MIVSRESETSRDSMCILRNRAGFRIRFMGVRLIVPKASVSILRERMTRYTAMMRLISRSPDKEFSWKITLQLVSSCQLQMSKISSRCAMTKFNPRLFRIRRSRPRAILKRKRPRRSRSRKSATTERERRRARAAGWSSRRGPRTCSR